MDADPRSPVCLGPHFEFLPIDSSKGQIRVLKIAPGRTSDPIRCAYQVLAVDGDEPYQTLSYVWGQMDGTKSIIVEGTKVELTNNLFAALIRIRNETETRHLWVDALCINQEDNAEKTAQVNMMHQIYSKCEQCNIWMGDIETAAVGGTEQEAIDAAHGAFDALRIIAGDYSTSPSPYLATGDHQFRAGKALKVMLFTAWWGRIWTVQEATSPLNAAVLWGPCSVPWSLVKKAADELIQGRNPPEERLNLSKFFADGDIGFFTAPVLGLLWATAWIVEPETPLEMLWRFRYRDSTDPRDKVYVILNLVAEGTNPLPSVPSSDYTINTAVLYRRVMLDLLRGEWGLRPMIGTRGERKSVPGLPTWVVDWSLPPAGLGIATFWEYRNFWFSNTADKGLPMLDRERMTSPEHGDDVLNLNGVFFDKVLACSDPIPKNEEDERIYEMTMEVIDAALAKEPRYRFISEVYWQNSFVDIVEGNHADIDDTFEGLRADYYWKENMLWHQQFFVTANGAVGLGPTGTAVGDEVWILSGGRSPFLLSPLDIASSGEVKEKEKDASRHYTFRGDCFVPGIMEGQAVESRIENQEFVHIH
ncbi:HET-domain-containing protein [Nemania sp. FL0916]|nr:HET-domain-containing protein [Nemania sp. FL0916]